MKRTTGYNNKFVQKWPKCLIFLYYKLTKFMQAEIGTALMPFQYKLAKRYSQYYPTESTRKHFEFVV